MYVVSDLSSTDEIAALIGKPGMKWVKFPTEDFRDRGVHFEDFVAGGHTADGTSIEQFAKRYAEIYAS